MSLVEFTNIDIQKLFRNKGLLLDIRTRDEYLQGHIKGAILISTPIPHPPLNKREIETLYDQLWFVTKDKHKNITIALYCKKGVRASMAYKILNRLGYNNVYVLGGMEVEGFTKKYESFIEK